jgi:hypothetical protein
MELDYIENFNEYGDNIVRLYNFDKLQAIQFCQILHQIIIVNKSQLDLSTIDFIEARNCSLMLRISSLDEGITSSDNKIFYCDLTISGYEQMLLLLEPFCKKETKGYQMLYDIDSLTDFLFSPSGTW